MSEENTGGDLNIYAGAEPGEVITLREPIEPCNICFNDGLEEIGRLDWNDGNMSFSGNVEESAKIFFEEFFLHFSNMKDKLLILELENATLKEELEKWKLLQT